MKCFVCPQKALGGKMVNLRHLTARPTGVHKNGDVVRSKLTLVLILCNICTNGIRVVGN